MVNTITSMWTVVIWAFVPPCLPRCVLKLSIPGWAVMLSMLMPLLSAPPIILLSRR